VLIHSLDAGSRQTARDVAELVEANALPAVIPSAGTSLVQVVDSENRVRAGTAERRSPGPAAASGRAGAGSRRRRGVVPGSRVTSPAICGWWRGRPPGRAARGTILVAAPTHSVQESTDAVRDILLVAYPLLLAALALLAWRVVGANPTARSRSCG